MNILDPKFEYVSAFNTDIRVSIEREKQRLAQESKPFSYSPTIETICSSCGGKHVGRCPLNACHEHEYRRY